MAGEGGLAIEVVYALADSQDVIALEVPAGTTVGEAIHSSGLGERHGIDLSSALTGIFSRRVSLETVLRDGDRVEIYRPLKADPKQARRRRAAR